jgi:FkbM family methyltransferase
MSLPLVRRLVPPSPERRIVWARTRWGDELEVLTDDLEGRSLELMGEWDPRITWTCRRILRSGDTFVDVGANFGLESLEGAKAVGPQGRAHAFEPQPEVAAMLRRSAERNRLPWLTVHQVALSDQEGEMCLNVPDGHSGAASLVRSGNGEAEGIRVSVRRGDDYLRAQGVGEIRLLKIDVEGHEPQVFAGMRPLFETTPPHAVIFESNEWFEGLSQGKKASDYTFRDLPSVEFLRKHGYRFYAFGRSYFRVNLYRTPADAPEHPPVSDFLAVHESRAGEILSLVGGDN